MVSAHIDVVDGLVKKASPLIASNEKYYDVIPEIPGALKIGYDGTISAGSGSGNIEVLLFGAQVTKLTGTYDWTKGTASLSDNFDVDIIGWDIVSGDFGLAVDSTGIKVTGDLKLEGKEIRSFSTYVITWPR